ncbi:MAG TPA: SHOCT domain-containing protein [Candidatus Saccharibacteria bacterium]|nr:SHOCT domain-containing protein [Candidatus Saccharibacteria bacterium]
MPGLLRGMARVAVVSGTATAVSNNVSRRQARRYGEQDAQEYQAQQPVAQAPSEDDQMAQLEKLGQLHDSGVLTDEEFAAKKKQILGL